MKQRWKFVGISRNGLWYVWEAEHTDKKDALLVAWAPVKEFWNGFLPLSAEHHGDRLSIITR